MYAKMIFKIEKCYINRYGVDEIASPDKLVSASKYDFEGTFIQGNFYFVATFSDYYIVTDCLSMFDKSTPKDYKWLRAHWNCLALITSAGALNDIGHIVNNYNYTIFNGLTLYLAYHRKGDIKVTEALPTLEQFVATFSSSPIQPVNATWESLYYGRCVPNIADLPWYYVCMGPQWADTRVIGLLQPDPFVYHHTDTSIFLASPRTAMYPYFNRDIYFMTENENVEIEVLPNIRNFLIAFTRTKRTMRYFMSHTAEVLAKINRTMTGFTFHFIKAYRSLYYDPLYASKQGRLTAVMKRVLRVSNGYIFCMIKSGMDIPFPVLKHTLQNTLITKQSVSILENATGENVATFFNKYIKDSVMYRFRAIYKLTESNYTVRQILLAYLKENKSMLLSIT